MQVCDLFWQEKVSARIWLKINSLLEILVELRQVSRPKRDSLEMLAVAGIRTLSFLFR